MTFLVAAFLSATFAVASLDTAQGQSPERFFITWEAVATAPPWYQGRVLPPPGGRVAVTLAGTDGGGKILDLSRYRIVWYLEGRFLAGGAGLVSMNITLLGSSGDQSVRAAIYDGDTVVGEVSATVPTEKPKVAVVIESVLEDPPTLLLRALPFFFNTTSPEELNFSWHLFAGGSPGGTKDTFFVPATPTESAIGWVSVGNPRFITENIKRYLLLSYETLTY
jgi:hypothetical protein